MVFMMGCLAKDNNDNNDANALHCRSRQGKRNYMRKSKVWGVPERVERWWLKAKKEKWGKGSVRWRWKTCQLSYSSPEFFVLQSARRRKYYFASIDVPLHLLPPPSALLLQFPLSLIESSNFRLHSPSACLLCRPVRIQRTLCRNLGTRTGWRVHSPSADSRLKRRRTDKKKKKKDEEPRDKMRS